jgi:hypothetical protein
MTDIAQIRHCEAQQRQSSLAQAFALSPAGLPRRLRRLAMTVVGAGTLAPSLVVAHPGHGAPVFHSHAWEIGLALVAAIVVAGLVIHFRRTDK